MLFFSLDFDEWDARDTRKLSHEELIIPANGNIRAGLYVNALDVDGSQSQDAEVQFIKPDILVREECFGKAKRTKAKRIAFNYLSTCV